MTTRILALLLLSTTLAGCDGLAALEGKPSPFRAEQERRAALTLPPTAAVEPTAPAVEEAAPTVADTPATAIEEAAPAAPEPAAPAVCEAIFRTLSCGDNGEFIYL